MIQKLVTYFDSNPDLPGVESHAKLTPYNRTESIKKEVLDSARLSAVMVLLWESASKINCALIQRPDYDGVHSSQMAFPGGKKELSDASLLETAFRETKEEIGVDKDHLTVIGSLTKLYIPPSNFMVYPYITYSKIIPEFLLDETEVAEVVPFDIVDLLQKSTRQDAYVTIANGKKLKTPSFQIEGKTVWGATAAILSEFKDIIEEL